MNGEILLVFFIFYIIVMYIILNISLYKVLIKENKDSFLAFIPFYNLYLYFNYCKLPFWTFFVPFLNLLVLFLSPYNFCKNFRCKNYFCVLAVVLPYLFLPYIGFSNLMHKDFSRKKKFLTNLIDVDRLEENLINSSNSDELTNENFYSEKSDHVESIVDNFVTSIENEVFIDDIYYDDSELNSITISQDDIMKLPVETIDKLNEDSINQESISISNLDTLEDKIINDSKNIVNIDTNYKDFEEVKPSEEAIAFGGTEKSENYNQAKVDELKCERCGSSLIGARDICPGCGTKI